MPNLKPLYWPDTVAARRLLSALDPDRLGLAWHQPTFGDKTLVIAGEAPNGEGITDELQKLRSAFTDKLFGCTFAEAMRQNRAGEYLALWEQQPEPQAVLAERFGDPMRLIGFGKNTAERLWRDEAKERVAQEIAA